MARILLARGSGMTEEAYLGVFENGQLQRSYHPTEQRKGALSVINCWPNRVRNLGFKATR